MGAGAGAWRSGGSGVCPGPGPEPVTQLMMPQRQLAEPSQSSGEVSRRSGLSVAALVSECVGLRRQNPGDT